MFKKSKTPNYWLKCSDNKYRIYHYTKGVDHEEGGFHRAGYICGNGHREKELEGLHIDRRTRTWFEKLKSMLLKIRPTWNMNWRRIYFVRWSWDRIFR